MESLERREVLSLVITEIMYHPASEIDLEEFIEVYNSADQSVSLAGWRLSNGVDFVFPDVTVGASDYLVVASDVATFNSKYPSVPDVVGGWSGRLSNRGESIELVDGSGSRVDRVEYADQGDWAVRAVGPLDRGSRGWIWQADHDGGGKSLELVNLALPNQHGQNWAASKPDGGSPGAPNSVAAANTAPLILDVIHSPAIPRSSDAVTVTAHLRDETSAGNIASLFWRVDGAADFSALDMADDGQRSDGDAGDGVYAATIPAQPDGTVVEFFVSANDAFGSFRFWPSLVQPTLQQDANLLYQVLDSHDPDAEWVPGSPPIYYQIMTAAEREEFTNIVRQSDAQMNATFISVTGTGVDVRYNVGVRIRGSNSRSNDPPNNRINIPSDRPWQGITRLNINALGVGDQIAGSALFRLAGLPAADAKAVRMMSNGVNLYGDRLYAHVEPLNSEFAENHFSTDNGGNLYKGRRPNESPPGGRGAGLAYFGPDPAPYVSYTKLTNANVADWSDVVDLTFQLNNSPDETYAEDVSQVADVDQWLRYLALNALLDNNEGGLPIGDAQGDDYAMYRGVEDPRFRMIPHDLDSLFGRTDRDIFRARGVPALDRMLGHPEFLRRYYGQLMDLIDNVLLADMVDTALDESLRHVLTRGQINQIKTFLRNRSEYVLNLIPQGLTVDSGLPAVGRYLRADDSVLTLRGTAHAAETRSVLVNGRPADSLPGDGSWSFTGREVTGETQTLVAAGAVWRYLDDGSDQGAAWRQATFDDASWNSGPAVLGYGDNNENTVVEFIDTTPGTPGNVSKNATTYFRSTFDVNDPSSLGDLRIRMRYDDAAAVYINGVEAARTDNFPNGARFDTYSVVDTPNENAYFDFQVPANVLGSLVAGENTIAAEVHQGDAFSSDIKFDLELTAASRGELTNAVILNPGINRVFVEAFDGPDGTGRLLGREFIDVWYDGPAENTLLKSQPAEIERIDLAVRDSYLPGVPLLVRVEALDNEQNVQRGLWDAVVTLSTDRPGVTLSPNQVRLYNGMGSALVQVQGFDDFTLTAQLGSHVAVREIASLDDAPLTIVSGTLAGTSTQWSGIVFVTDDVTVPSGHTLSVAPGTLVVLDGDAVGATNSTLIRVQGTLQSHGTPQQPITFTASDAQDVWGQIDVVGGEARFDYTNIHRAGNAPRQGHTGTGAGIRLSRDSVFEFNRGSITDLRGKVMQSTSGEVTFTDSLLSRAVMGPEIEDTSLEFRDSWIVEMAGIHHFGGEIDDNDGIYLHDQQPGQSIVLSGGVVANTQDDGIDTLRADATIENYIVRDIADKAVSIFDGEVTIRQSLLVDSDIGVNTKGAGSSTPHTIIDRTTIAGVNFGIVAQDKDAPDPNVVITYDVNNSIIRVNPGGDPISTDYDPLDIHIAYSNVGESWPGTGNINQDPVFNDASAGDYRLRPGSPSVDAGDPAVAPEDDGTPVDHGYFGNGIGGALAPPTIPVGTIHTDLILAPFGGPYRIAGDVVIAPEARVTVLPGTTVYFEPGAELSVEGIFHARGTPYQRIRFTSVPDAPFVPNLPAGAVGLPEGPPRWRGIHFRDSSSDQNVIAYADIEYAQDRDGAIGLIDSAASIENVTWHGTHLRMIYADESSAIVRNSVFPDMFADGESPAALGLDNIAEHIKMVGGIPAGGRFVIEGNVFGTNRGHNDVIDADSNLRPGPILQIIDNIFLGAGDELLDLGGDVYVAGNVFANVSKDDETSDRRYANAISTGDVASPSTIAVARNVFWNVDHAIHLRRDTAAIFENNTVVTIHDDFVDRFGNLNVGSAINMFIDVAGEVPGAGAYLADNIFSDLPRVFGNVDLPTGMANPLEFHNNLVDESLRDSSVGDRAGTVFDLGAGNVVGAARFSDPLTGDFALTPGSPAIGAGQFGQDLGAAIAGGAWITGEPPALTSETTANLTVGGPGIFAFMYRLDGGPWSDVVAIGSGFVPNGPIVRSGSIQLSQLGPGEHDVEVLGQDFAGVWQQQPTVSRSWTVGAPSANVRINELLALNRSVVNHEGVFPDLVELHNSGAVTTDLSRMSLSDRLDEPRKFVFPAGTMLAAGEYLTLYADSLAELTGLHLGFSLDGDGEGLYLFESDSRGGALVDSVEFGVQVPDLSIGRLGNDGSWGLAKPTIGGPNVGLRTGDVSNLSINEWFANGLLRLDDDFLELYNPDPLPVAIGGLYLTDEPNFIPDKFQIPALSFIDGGGFTSFVADGDTAAGANHLNFRLSADQELLGLYDAELRELDRLLYFSQTTDVSQGRSPDGASALEFYRLPTPSTANFVPRAGDANFDRQFDQRDIIAVLQAAKYLTQQPAGFDEGDWNDDGVFDQFDVIAALRAGTYLQGPYTAKEHHECSLP